jgi:hypothetical protein
MAQTLILKRPTNTPYLCLNTATLGHHIFLSRDLVNSPDAQPKKEIAACASLISPLSASLFETSAPISLEQTPRENNQHTLLQ